MKKCLYFLLFVSVGMQAQVYKFAEDELQRGWYERPYERYEAEEGYCETNGVFLAKSDNQRDVQSEASHQQAVELSSIGSKVEWSVATGNARGITIRFSVQDSEDGKGQRCYMRLTASKGEEKILTQDFVLDSYWAWQYTARGGNYPDNTPSQDKMVRMKFDEVHFLLDKEIPEGSILRIEVAEQDSQEEGQEPTEGSPVTDKCVIDFIELESVPEAKTPSDYAEYGEITVYNAETDGELSSFVNNNQGKNIYLPAGRIDVASRIYLKKKGTRLLGAGSWYTELYFTASSDNASTYSNRGIESSADSSAVEGMTLNTINNKRYYMNNDSKQVGKGFMGGFGTGSVIRDCWVEHFECGGWIADYSGKNSSSLLVENCRFRNNYADGINLCKASTNHIVRNCSFRNNGDDDMASWSTGNLCSGCVFEYCTAENNWRASSLAFFGGQNQTAHHIAVYDALECGVRMTCDFPGTGFKSEGRMYMHDITIRHCGCKSGTWGQYGDFWGNMQGALTLSALSNYDLNNAELYDIDIEDSRTNAIYLRGSNGKKINNLVLEDINIRGAAGYGIYFSGATGSARICNITYEDCTSGEQTAHMKTFEISDCSSDGLTDAVTRKQETAWKLIEQSGMVMIVYNDKLYSLTGICAGKH